MIHGRTLAALLRLREFLTESEIVEACREFALYKIQEGVFRRIETRIAREQHSARPAVRHQQPIAKAKAAGAR